MARPSSRGWAGGRSRARGLGERAAAYPSAYAVFQEGNQGSDQQMSPILPLFRKSIDERFHKFDRENPQVYRKLVEMSFQLYERGHRRAGVAMFFEVLRWDSMLKTTGDDFDFKLNDNFASRYARKIEEEHPVLRGFFETRRLRSP